jgi:multiple sugar transport system substrate-binding protein
MKRSLPVLLAIFLVASFPLLANGQKESGQASASTQKQINLGIIWWGSQTRDERTIKVIKMYEKAHPNVHITYQFAGWSDYWTKVTTQAAGKNLPDIMQQDYAYVREWTARNLLTNLDPYISSGAIDLSHTSAPFIDGGKVNGHMYAIDLGANSQTWVLDTDAFKKAGIPIPASDWTWQDFEKISLELHQKLGIFGMGPNLTNEQIWKSLYLGLGEWGYAADGKSVGYKSDKPFVDFLHMALRLQKAGAIPNESDVVTYLDKGPEQLPIVSGQSAMAYVWSNQIVALTSAAGKSRHFQLHLLPRVAGGKSSNYIKNGQFFSITSQSKNPQAAAQFINFFTNSVDANKVLLAERGVPISTEVQKALTPLLGPANAAQMNFVALVGSDHNASPTPPPDPAGAANVIQNVYQPQVIQPVMFGKITPEMGAKILREKADAILSGKQQ